MTPQIPRFTTPIIATTAQSFAQNQNDFINLSMFKTPKKPFIFENDILFWQQLFFIAVNQNTVLWTLKLGFNELISLHQFFIATLSTTAPFGIEIPFATTQQQKKLNFASSRLQKPITFFYFFYFF